jgi:trk system potassium uptake protein TrkH
VFHSISSFCTAGFSPFPDSLQRFAADPWVLGTTGSLSLLGALGFLVLSDLGRTPQKRRLRTTLTSRTIVTTTFSMVLVGAVGLYWIEPEVARLPWLPRVSAALFQAVNALTTTGFSSLPIASFAAPAVLLVTLMMICGASPSGTGGGLKSTSVAAALATTWAMLRGHRHVRLLGREIPEHRIRLALASIVFYVLIYFLGFLALAVLEEQGLEDLGFEAASALGTVGLSRGVTAELSWAGKLVLIGLMYIGRIGPITFGLAIFFDREGDDPAEQKVSAEGPPETDEEEKEDLAVS